MIAFNFFIIILLGLVIGSFLGAFTYRLPKKIKISEGRSFCPKCKRQISWYDNIPILSYIILGRRCRSCHKKISLRYPLIELATAFCFVLVWYFAPRFTGWENLGFLALPFLFFVIATSIIVFVIDFEHQIIPDEVIFFGLGLVLIMFILSSQDSFYIHLASAFGASLFLLLIHLATLGRGMGLGDAKYALFTGFILGWPLMPLWLFLAFLTGAIVGVILILIGRASLGKRIPFGPFLAFSFILVLLWGNQILGKILPLLF